MPYYEAASFVSKLIIHYISCLVPGRQFSGQQNQDTRMILNRRFKEVSMKLIYGFIDAYKRGRLKSIYLFGQLLSNVALECCSRNED